MPKTRRTRRTRRKYRRKPYRKRKPRLGYPIGGFSNSKLVRLKWCEEVSLDAGSNSYAIRTFGANNAAIPYDGNNTHQPSNYDIWAKRYQRNAVLGSKITVKLMPSTSGGIVPAYIGLYKTNDTNELTEIFTNYGGIGYMLEQKKVVNMRALGHQTTSGTLKPLVVTCSPSKMFGVSKATIKNEQEYSAKDTNGPLNKTYFQLFSHSIDGNNPSKLIFMVSIEYLVLFKGLEEQEQN